MRKLFLLFFAAFIYLNALAQIDLKLWYNKPARNWNEALPIGNGRLGAMVFGKVNEELIQLNEETLWSGGPVNTNPNPLAVSVFTRNQKSIDCNEDYAGSRKADFQNARVVY